MPRKKLQTKRQAESGASSLPLAGPAAGGYAGLLTDEERDALRGFGDGTLREEIALLRVLVRRELSAGATAESIRRLVREIGQAVKVERSATASEGDAIQLALADLLTEVNERAVTASSRGDAETPR